MKVLVFAHTPPPHHGQSYMVELMLAGFGGDRRQRRNRSVEHEMETLPENGEQHGIECYHVNTRLSRHLEDIGDLRVGKFFLLLGYCFEAIWCRFKYGVRTFYYIPAPGKRSALYRDWLVMLLCRPFFDRIILHWHASGLARWLETVVQVRSRSLTYSAAKQADLSIVLSNYGRADAEKLYPLRIAVVGNGIPDPCPSFAERLLPRRRARLAIRRSLLAGAPVPDSVSAAAGPDKHVLRVLFMAHCTRDKGLFDVVQGAMLAHDLLEARKSPICLQLQIAGQFVHPDEEAEFLRVCASADPKAIQYVGFVSGERKRQLFEDADVFCFPSHLESFGLVLVEAMAFGLPIVTTRCGAVPEVMSAGYPGLVDVRSPEQISHALVAMMSEGPFEELRSRFENNFTVEKHLSKLAAALRLVETKPVAAQQLYPAFVQH